MNVIRLQSLHPPQAPSRDNLRIREDGVGGVFVENLSEHVVRNTAGIMSLLKEGARLRTTATTKMNKVKPPHYDCTIQ